VYGLVAYADPPRHLIAATPAMTGDTPFPFSFPAVGRKKITAAFDGGRKREVDMREVFNAPSRISTGRTCSELLRREEGIPCRGPFCL
jgi:hypothetical protein